MQEGGKLFGEFIGACAGKPMWGRSRSMVGRVAVHSGCELSLDPNRLVVVQPWQRDSRGSTAAIAAELMVEALARDLFEEARTPGAESSRDPLNDESRNVEVATLGDPVANVPRVGDECPIVVYG